MEKLFLGICNHVVCLNKETGEQVWKTKLKSSTITNVYFDNGNVFAYSGGHFFCLNGADGEIIWENPLKGLGYSTCIIASDHQSASVIAGQAAAQQAAAAGVIVSTTATTSGS